MPWPDATHSTHAVKTNCVIVCGYPWPTRLHELCRYEQIGAAAFMIPSFTPGLILFICTALLEATLQAGGNCTSQVHFALLLRGV